MGGNRPIIDMKPLVFRQLLDHTSHTYSYIIGNSETREAVLIDSVKEHVDRDLTILNELGLQLTYALETHIHADHITGACYLKQKTSASILLGCASGVKRADHLLSDGEIIYIGSVPIHVISTPGHTKGCISFLCNHKVFTGDALLIRSTGRCDFQEGSAKTLYDSIYNKLYTLPDSTIVYPGHDYHGLTCSSVREEKQFNSRITTKQTKEAFVGIMDSLNLPYPKKMDIAVPANLCCGAEDIN